MRDVKKYFALSCLVLFSIVANADYIDFNGEIIVEIDGICYKFNGDEATVTYQSYDGDMGISNYSGSVVIPEFVIYNGKTYSVTSIGVWAFQWSSGLTSISIPNSVTSIGSSAFSGCSGLTSISIPNSVTSIGSSAFSGCSGLQKVIVTDIAAWCGVSFSGFYANPLSYAHHLYSNEETEITDLVIPNNVTSIGGCAFYGCTDLTSVTIPNSVISIGSDAFSGTAWYNNQPDGLVFAGKVAYKYKGTMPSGTHILIKDGTLGIASGAFENCSDLTSITIPNSVTSIGDYVFSGCSGLTSVNFPNSVISIGNNAFYKCSGLTTITIPNSITSIGNYVFCECSSLSSVTIPNSVISIEHSAFSGCSGLTSITIPNSVTSIGGSAFSYCSGLTTVTIPNSVTSIGSSAFNNCSGLTTVTIGSGVTSIGNYAFNGCSGLTSVTIPNSVTSIGYLAFSGCSSLTSVTIGNSVTSIGNSAFAGCSSLISITIPNSVTSIGYRAFGECSGLNSITIGSGVTSIGGSAFSGCSSLKDVTLQCQVIGKWFSGYTFIETIEIGDGTESIAESAFSGCTGLKSLTIGKTVTSIEYSAFSNCSNLQSVTSHIETPFWIDNSVFQYSLSGSTILYVPKGKKQTYQNTFAWNQFPTILEISGDGEQKCATPTISYANGKLKFNCETEDVSYIYEITDSDIKIGYDKEADLTVTYNITVYATKDGYQDSEAATATLCWIDVEPQTEGIIDEDAIAEVKAMPVLIQSQGSIITIQGAAEGTPIAVYDIEGKQYGTSLAEKNRTTITTSLRPGSIAIVKIGEKSVKVKL